MAKTAKKPTTSKGKVGRPTGVKIKGVKEKFIREYSGQDPHVEFHPEPKVDEEDAPTPKDKASKHQYPPPKKNAIFRAKWMKFINNVTRRENFNVAHLDSLEILCDLYVEYDVLQTFIRVNGRSYKAVGRQGVVWKFYPEVNQLSRVQAQIKEYTKMLGLLLKKDHGKESDGDDEEWE